jgi:hypothetical protein
MKSATILIGALIATVSLGLGTRAARGEDKGQTNAVAIATNIPMAVFDLKAQVVKDPFYPLSTRSPVPITVVTNIAPPVINASSFELKGLMTEEGGQVIQVTINGHPFGLGETASIRPKNGDKRVQVTVVQFKEYSVVLQVEGFPEPLELSLRKDLR